MPVPSFDAYYRLHSLCENEGIAVKSAGVMSTVGSLNKLADVLWHKHRPDFLNFCHGLANHDEQVKQYLDNLTSPDKPVENEEDPDRVVTPDADKGTGFGF